MSRQYFNDITAQIQPTCMRGTGPECTMLPSAVSYAYTRSFLGDSRSARSGSWRLHEG